MFIDKKKLHSRLQQRKAVEQYLERRSAADASFKALLLENPARAIEQMADIRLPAEVTVRIVLEHPEELCLVLPFLPESEAHTIALSDEDLAWVNGGTPSPADLMELITKRLNGQLKFLPDK